MLKKCRICKYTYHVARYQCPTCGAIPKGTKHFIAGENRFYAMVRAIGALSTGSYPRMNMDYRKVD